MPFDITKLESQTIIFGGLTLVALALVWAFLRVIKDMNEKHAGTDKLYFNHTNDVIDRNTKAWVENTRSNQMLVDTLNNGINAKVELKTKKRKK